MFEKFYKFFVCYNHFVVFLLILLLFGTPCFSEEESSKPSLLIVNVPAADLRREPVSAKENDFSRDPLQETQLLYGEKVRLIERRDGWSRVEALEQLEWTHHKKWEGYPGWIPSDHLTAIPLSGWKPDAVISTSTAAVHQTLDTDSPILLNLFMGTKIKMIKDTDFPVGAVREPPLPTSWQNILLIDGRTG